MTTNKAYLSAITSQKRYLVLYGGAGSGKSYFAAQKVIARCDERPGERILVVRKVARTIKGSTFQLLRDVIARERFECAVNRAEMSIRFPNGSEIIHAGLDDVEKLKSIAGITSIWVEEATELTEADFDQLDLRLRGQTPAYKQIIVSFNPINGRHWLRTKLVETDRTDVKVSKTTWRDNAFIDPEYKRVLLSVEDDNFRRIYDEGEWGEDLKGLIITNWTTTTARVVEPDCYGLDFGFNNPNALVAVVDADPDLHVEELLYESHLRTADIVAQMRELDISRSVPLYCDSARPDQIADLVAAGYFALPANKDVLAGIQTLKGYRLRVHEGSQNLINELGAYKWMEKRDGEIQDKPLKAHDHAIDAVRYAAHTHLSHAIDYSQP